jgi:hypothetical protein
MKQLRNLYFLALMPIAIFSGDFGGANNNVSRSPAYVSLARGLDSFKAEIIDDGNEYTIRDFSFGGITKIGGARRIGDDSGTMLDVDIIKEMKILDRAFEAGSPGDTRGLSLPIFIKAEITFFSGKKEEYLLPYDLTVCGQMESGAGKAWRLRDLDSINNLGKLEDPVEIPRAPIIPSEKYKRSKDLQQSPKESRPAWKKVFTWGN